MVLRFQCNTVFLDKIMKYPLKITIINKMKIRMVIGHEESLFKKGYCLGHPSDTYGTEISV